MHATVNNDTNSTTAGSQDAERAGIIQWLRGAGYVDAANALAELHAEDMALRGVSPYPFALSSPPSDFHAGEQ